MTHYLLINNSKFAISAEDCTAHFYNKFSIFDLVSMKLVEDFEN
jgi:hypothetical protein